MTDLTKESNDRLLSFRSRGLDIRFGIRHDEEGEGCGQHTECLWVNCKEVFLLGRARADFSLSEPSPTAGHTLLCHMGCSCAKAGFPIPETERALPDLGAGSGRR